MAASVATSGTTSSAAGARAEQPGEELAEEGEARDADGQRQQAEQDAEGDAPAQPAVMRHSLRVEMHVGLPRYRRILGVAAQRRANARFSTAVELY